MSNGIGIGGFRDEFNLGRFSCKIVDRLDMRIRSGYIFFLILGLIR
jgi:hypothetical protein